MGESQIVILLQKCWNDKRFAANAAELMNIAYSLACAIKA
jgi:hypothetical protein